MSIVKCKAANGTVYVYESTSYYDKELKQSRPRRKLIGKIDEKTGEIIPTHKKGSGTFRPDGTDVSDKYMETIARQEEVISSLNKKISTLEKEKAELLSGLRNLMKKFD